MELVEPGPNEPETTERPGHHGGVTIELLRPSAGTAILPGQLINGIGWISADAPVVAVDIGIGFAWLGRARLGVSATELAMLIGHPPAEAVTGFVFAVTVPELPPGPATLRLQVETGQARHDRDVQLIVQAPPQSSAAPVAAQPIGAPWSGVSEKLIAMIEMARIDERGLLRVAGWIASLTPIEHLRVFVGPTLLGEAQRDLPRADVAAVLPLYPNAATSGFLLLREVGAHEAERELALEVVAQGDIRGRFIAPLVRPERVQPRPAEIVAHLACEDLQLTEHGLFTIKGWAVAASGVAEICVELDAEVIGTTIPTEERPDVGNRFPRIADARHAGFRLQRRLAGGFTGDHVVRVTVRGRAGEAAACFEPVAVQSADQAATGADDDAIRCYLDAPACQDGVAIETVRGFLSLSGWAFGRDGIDRIEVFVDGVAQGRAHHGIRREDLQAAFPDHDTRQAGFAMVLPPQVMRDGERAIRIDIHDRAGRIREIGLRARAEPPPLTPGPWMLRTKLPQAEIDLHHAILAANGRTPCWAVVLAVPDPTQAGRASQMRLATTIKSLAAQASEEWTLTLLTGDIPSWLTALLAALPDATRARTRVLPRQPERPLAALAEAADFLAWLAPGDELGEDALLQLSLAASLEPTADFLYSDERRRDPADGRMKAFFKPDFSPDLLLSTNYIGRLWAAAPALLREVDLREGGFAAAGEYDAVLRLTERAGKIVHVPHMLCARSGPGETRALERQALRRAMARRGLRGTLRAGPIQGTHRLRRTLTTTALVSIIIPTSGARGLIETAIGSIRAHTDWKRLELICVDNMPPGAPLKGWVRQQADRTIETDAAFNWSRFNNLAARQARGKFLLFLNDDIEVRDPRWLHGLIEHAQRPEIGAVGPQLVYPDGRVQHAGMFLGRNAARHAFRFYARDEAGPFGLALTQRDVISVTGACLMTRSDVFDALGGFDEAHAVINNDLDYCLRVRASGRGVVYTPSVSLVHHEAVSRAALPDAHDAKKFAAAWGDLFLRGDPFFSRHLSPEQDGYLPDAEPVKPFAAGRPLFARARIRRILAIKVDHIGDFVTAFPAFRRLKQHFPDAELTVLAAAASRALADLEPAIDHFEEFNFYHARSEHGRRPVGERELALLSARLAPKMFDLAIDLRCQPDTRPVLQATGARWRAGFDSGHQHRWLDIAVPFEGDQARTWKTRHVSDTLVGLIDAVSAQAEPSRSRLPDPAFCAAGRAAARRALAERLGRPEAAWAGPVVCLHTGAGALNKQWPAASFAGLIDLLAATPATLVVIGGPDEAAFARHVVASARRGASVHDLVGKTTLRELPEVLRAADLYVGNDSGPKHIAAALGVPTIGIHSGSVDAGEWGAVGPHTLTIRRDMHCSPCYLALASDCHRGLACLDGIRVADVADACRKMLALTRTPVLEAAAE